SLADQCRGSGVSVVRFDNNRAARGQCRGGISAGRREREREVAGTEHCHRAEGNLPLTQIRRRRRSPVRLGRVNPHFLVSTNPQLTGKESQLAGGTAQFASQATERKA